MNLDEIEPSIAVPFHPSNVYTIKEFRKNAKKILKQIEEEALEIGGESCEIDLLGKLKDGEFYVDQGIIAGCAGGTFDNIVAATDILDGKSIGNGKFSMSVYSGSQPAYRALVENGSVGKLMDAGVIVRSAFCGPCFGAGDTPANNEFSIRHTTRNFPNREGSKPTGSQMSFVALMDARSIAATAANGGRLTGADEIDVDYSSPEYVFEKKIYDNRNYDGVLNPEPDFELVMGPSIKDWPKMEPMKKHLLIKMASMIFDEVTTTDELIPSGETSSYRSDPYKLSEYTLSRRDPDYVKRAKAIREDAKTKAFHKFDDLWRIISSKGIQIAADDVSYGSSIFAKKPGDGSAREHAASCQKVLGGWANIAHEYATKRYRSNLINWGMVPFIIDEAPLFELGDYVLIQDLRDGILSGKESFMAYSIGSDINSFELKLNSLTDDEKKIIVSGCLMNFYNME